MKSNHRALCSIPSLRAGWRPLAGFFLLMIYFAGDFFALIVRLLFHTDWGQLVNIRRLIWIVWNAGFHLEPVEGPPVVVAWIALFCIIGVCVWMLNRKIRAYEVVK